MLKLDLARLERAQRLRVDAEIPPDDPLWEGSELTFGGPVRVDLTAIRAGAGEIVVRGRVGGRLALECRRCLEPVEVPVDRELTLVWMPVDELGSREDDGETRVFGPEEMEVDLGGAIREELVLGTDRYVECTPGCRGFCPRCGKNLNTEQCDCVKEESDPRWDALRALMTD